ncbi:MAG: hypothetical protein KC418_23685, partial [Anaerolineales bacterium]|nr:hypothetical protein [Anaerolineales bacterium]
PLRTEKASSQSGLTVLIIAGNVTGCRRPPLMKMVCRRSPIFQIGRAIWKIALHFRRRRDHVQK